MIPSLRRPLLYTVPALCVVLATPATAIDALDLTLGDIAGEGWSARDVSLRIAFTASADAPDDGFTPADIRLTAATLELPAPVGTLANVELSCPGARLDAQELRCEDGTLRARTALLDRERVGVSFGYRMDTQALHVQAREAGVAGGRLRIDARLEGGAWQVDYGGAGIDLARLAALLDGMDAWPQGLTAAGRATLSGTIAGAAAQLQRVELDAKLDALAFADAEGRNAGEAVALAVEVQATQRREDWQFRAAGAAHGGTVCVDTCWELPGTPVRFAFDGEWAARDGRLGLKHVDIDHANAMRVQGEADFALGDAFELRDLAALVDVSDLGAAYTSWLQPLSIGTPFEAVDAEGRVHARIAYQRNAALRVQGTLDGITVHDRNDRFAIEGLGGNIDWHSDEVLGKSNLSWRAGNVYAFALGAADLAVETRGSAVRLLQPLHVPVFDGMLEVESFSLEHPATERMKWQFDGVLTPVSMQAVSGALEWPVMAGKLSGVIPDVRYEEGVLTVGGVLLVRAFDGGITVRKLRLERLFGVVPTLEADIEIDNLDLDALTRTFSFGKIQGRLDGRVHGLRMRNWEAEAFDARIATPPDDRSRHRISQKAVDNLTNLGGGGVGGALSRSFLRMFEEFSYDRIGISCRLANGVCDMDGVAPAERGYYIVKGGGLPRIDIIGYSHRVDWSTLVQRLKSITASSGPVVR